MKQKLWIAWLLLTVLILSGCSHTDAEIIPDDSQSSESVSNISETLRSVPLTLCIPQNQCTSSITENITAVLLPYETPGEAAVKELLQRLNRQNEIGNVSLISFSNTAQTAVVNLTGDFAAFTDDQIFVLVYCLTNTLCDLDDIQYVNILVNDQALSYHELPYGVQSKFNSDAETALWQFKTHSAEIAENAALYSRKITMYFGSADAKYLIGEPQDIMVVGSQTIFDSLVNALAKGPVEASQIRLFPSTAYLSESSYSENESGNKTIFLRLEGSVYAYLTRNHIDPDLAAASVAMTVFDCCSDISSIQIAFDRNNSDIYSVLRSEEEMRLGTALEMYYPVSNGGITKVQRMVSTYESMSIDRVIDLMFDHPSYLENETIETVFPSTISREDVLSVSINFSTAIIRISDNFVTVLRQMEPEKERDMIYSIVNTLCRTKEVSRVTFLQEDNPCPVVTGRINLSDYLYFNPGIIQ